MRPMTPALEAAARNASHIPAIKVILVNKRANILRPQFTTLYSGTEEDNHYAACLAGDGSLIRARIQSSAPNYAVFRSRVANPGPGSDFSQWVYTGPVSTSTKVALASHSSIVLLFALDVDDFTIKVKESTDNGASWGDWSNIYTAASTPEYLAAAFNNDGTICVLFFSIGGVIYAIRRTNGIWGSPEAWTNSLNNIHGFSAIFDADWKLAIAGLNPSGRDGVWICRYTTSYSWTALQEVIGADDSTSINFFYPSLDKPSPFMLFFCEYYSGIEEYTQVRWTATAASAVFTDNLWLEPVGFNAQGVNSFVLIHNDTHFWLVRANKILRASMSSNLTDVSSDVISINMNLSPSDGTAAVELRNDKGQYNTLSLGIGAQMEIQWGYVTTSGPEYISPCTFWVELLEYRTGGGRGSLIIHGADAWSLLKHSRARYQYVWQSGAASILNILKWLFSRAGIAMQVLSSSPTITSQKPAFTVYANENYSLAIKRLLAKVPDVFFFRENTAYVLNPLSTDPSIYTYGISHKIIQAGYLSGPGEFNSFAVFGNNLVAYDWDWPGVELVWERLAQYGDKNLATAAESHQRGSAEARRLAMNSIAGLIVVPLNPGQELYDVIEITDNEAGLTAAKRRVAALKAVYDSQRGQYNLTITLSGA